MMSLDLMRPFSSSFGVAMTDITLNELSIDEWPSADVGFRNNASAA